MPPGLRRRHTSQEAALRRVIITRGGRRVTAQGSWASTLGAVSGGRGVWRGEGRVPPGPHGAHGQPGSPTGPHGPPRPPTAPAHSPERGPCTARPGAGSEASPLDAEVGARPPVDTRASHPLAQWSRLTRPWLGARPAAETGTRWLGLPEKNMGTSWMAGRCFLPRIFKT